MTTSVAKTQGVAVPILTALHPGVTFEQVRENVGWALKKTDPLKTSPLPSAQEIELLRTKLDPKRLHIK